MEDYIIQKKTDKEKRELVDNILMTRESLSGKSFLEHLSSYT